MLELAVIAILGLASYRLTRFLLFDTLIDGWRQRYYVFLINRNKPRLFWSKLLDLTSCSWCLGFWVSLAALSLYLGTAPWEFTKEQFISLFAIAGVQGFIHAAEPEGDDHEH